jgi:hypothetical protein
MGEAGPDMNIDTFFRHWSIAENPFKAEEARDDQVYARIMEGDQPVHPEFEKIHGSPDHPSTAVVFGEKGAGKTAIRLLMEKRLRDWNEANPERKAWVVRYDDLNPLLDRVQRFVDLRGVRKGGGSAVRLADHQDHLLSLVVTHLVDLACGADRHESAGRTRRALRQMSVQQRLDLAQMIALYDQPAKGSVLSRWSRMRRLLGVGSVFTLRFLLVVSLLLFAITLGGGAAILSGAAAPGLGGVGGRGSFYIGEGVAAMLFLITFCTWVGRWFSASRWVRKIEREVRAVDRVPGQLLAKFGQLCMRDLATQPMPVPGDQDSRYDLTARLVRVLGELGYTSLIVLVDRVDEPASIQGDPQKMKALVWPMLHNKFLQQERIGFKFLLPIELGYLVDKEDAAFYQQARLDKQNLVKRLEWTGATLYDVCTRRLQSCQKADAKAPLRLADLFAEDVKPQDLVEALDQMHQPRDAFKFLYQVIQEHCRNIPDETPVFRVAKSVLDQVRRRQSQRVQELQRGFAPA